MANLDSIPEVDILAEINRLILKHGEKKVKETLRLYLGEIINSTQPSIVTETEDLWFKSKEQAEAHMASLINNGDKDEFYVDTYEKTKNECIKGED